MKNIVIVGGGTAGWMAAIVLAARFPEKHITVVDPKMIAPLGVGESVTGVVLQFVTNPLLGLSVGEFFRRCDVTFKLGLWYKDWHGPGTEYLSPIDSPPQYFRQAYVTQAEEFFAWMTSQGARLGDVQLYSMLMRQGRTDHFRNPDGSVNLSHAFASCQFDALKFAGWLQEIGSGGSRPNIEHIDDVFESFEQHPETGHVTCIQTQGGRQVVGDFFLDCSGFHRVLLAKAFRPKWKSYADHIKVDSAITCFSPYTTAAPMPNYTLAAAMPHGWRWQIPTQSRLGNGYIFSSRHVSDEDAVADFHSAGLDAGDRPRIVRFDPGRFENQWQGNVCTIGLSGGFIEPLEASTIHGMSVQIQLLTELFFPFCTRDSMRTMADQYNKLVGAAYDDYVDFISFHYHTGRADTEFWREYQKIQSITPANQARLEKWKFAFPVREDFQPTYTQRAGLTTGLVLWAPMLCGMGLLQADHARKIIQSSRYPQALQENVGRYIQVRDRIVANALTQAEAIRFFQEQP